MMTPAPRFANDDEAAQHWLMLLREGDATQKIQAREQLAAIFERRGMFEEATDLLVSNARDGVRSADIFRWLARLYRAQGDEATAMQAAAEAAKLMPLEVDPLVQHSPVLVPESGIPPSAGELSFDSQGICRECGYVNSQRRSTCKRCRAALMKPDLHPAAVTQTPNFHAVTTSGTPDYSYEAADQPRRGSGSRIAAMVLGMLGAILGLFASLLALGIGGLGAAFGAEGGRTVVQLGWSALFFCFLGFLGAGFALSKPRFAGTVLMITAIGFVISISWFAVISGPLFFLASIFAFMGRARRNPTPEHRMRRQ